jgi:hypothetical protein
MIDRSIHNHKKNTPCIISNNIMAMDGWIKCIADDCCLYVDDRSYAPGPSRGGSR